jgi:hypothetical protein
MHREKKGGALRAPPETAADRAPLGDQRVDRPRGSAEQLGDVANLLVAAWEVISDEHYPQRM